MSTRKKSEAIQFLEELVGRPLTFSGMMESLRLCEEMSLTEFAHKLGISPSHLCDIEKGRKTVSPSRAAHFARILGLSEAQFVQLSLQDEMERSGLKLEVSIKSLD